MKFYNKISLSDQNSWFLSLKWDLDNLAYRHQLSHGPSSALLSYKLSQETKVWKSIHHSLVQPLTVPMSSWTLIYWSEMIDTFWRAQEDWLKRNGVKCSIQCLGLMVHALTPNGCYCDSTMWKRKDSKCWGFSQLVAQKTLPVFINAYNSRNCLTYFPKHKAATEIASRY